MVQIIPLKRQFVGCWSPVVGLSVTHFWLAGPVVHQPRRSAFDKFRKHYVVLPHTEMGYLTHFASVSRVIVSYMLHIEQYNNYNII